MDIIEQLRRDEGMRRTVYTDSVGVLTVGVGHNLRDAPLSDEAIDQMLRDDLAVVERACRELPVWSALSSPRRGVLLNMAFNLGVTGLSHFTVMLAKLTQGDYVAASAAMLDSVWASQVGRRATRLAEQMRTDVWQ
jgi:lysozyme